MRLRVERPERPLSPVEKAARTRAALRTVRELEREVVRLANRHSDLRYEWFAVDVGYGDETDLRARLEIVEATWTFAYDRVQAWWELYQRLHHRGGNPHIELWLCVPPGRRP